MMGTGAIHVSAGGIHHGIAENGRCSAGTGCAIGRVASRIVARAGRWGPFSGIAAVLLLSSAAAAAEFDLRPHFDESIPLANPHKGWYHHLYDNHVKKYDLESDEELLRFPGMDHIYLRLAWAYLQPEENRFAWEVIDKPIEKWTAHGLGVSFRISCKETSFDRLEQQFATPRWVREAGAKGHFDARRAPPSAQGSAAAPGEEPKLPWQPDYDDPIFLEKLDRFLAAFAARYDGKPWMRYLDIGSFGDWGEGHTGPRKYDFDALKKHVDLHLKHFRRTQLVISDDFVVHLSSPDEQGRMLRYLSANKVSFRDDSILVNGYLPHYSSTFTVRSPNFFAEAARTMPTVFELEHYGTVKKLGNWTAAEGSNLAKHGGGKTGPEFFRGALELLQATYIGYHGYAREWIKDNPQLTVELLNRCGYWFFPESVRVGDRLVAGQAAEMAIRWRNRGVAPAYFEYELIAKLDRLAQSDERPATQRNGRRHVASENTAFVSTRFSSEGAEHAEMRVAAGNTRWLPGETTWDETYSLAIPRTLPPGEYQLKIKLYSPQTKRDVKLPLKAERTDRHGFYAVGPVVVAGPDG